MNSEFTDLLRETANERRRKHQPRCAAVLDMAANENERLSNELTGLKEAIETYKSEIERYRTMYRSTVLTRHKESK